MRFKIFQSKANNGTRDKYYLRPVYDETVDLNGLAAHMASHNTPFTKGQLVAVLTDIVGCIKELCLDSKSVKIAGLGIFQARIRTKGAKTLKEFCLRENMLNLFIGCRGVDDFRSYRLEAMMRRNMSQVLDAKPVTKENTENVNLP